MSTSHNVINGESGARHRSVESSPRTGCGDSEEEMVMNAPTMKPVALMEHGCTDWVSSDIAAVDVGTRVFDPNRGRFAHVVPVADNGYGAYARGLVEDRDTEARLVAPSYGVYAAQSYTYPFATVVEATHPSLPERMVLVAGVHDGTSVWVAPDDYYGTRTYPVSEVTVRRVLFMP